jgi:hypothetical protein
LHAKNFFRNPDQLRIDEPGGQQVGRFEAPTGEEFAPIATEVAQIQGVEVVILRPHGIGIHKAMAFDWEDISPAAKEVLF